jgi:hypothetical protein
MTAAPPFAPKLKVLGVEAFEQPFRLRLPFRFGVITVTEGVQAFVRVHVRLDDGREGFGYAAETLAAKWFDKSANLSDAQNQDQLRKSIEIAADAYREAPPSTAFDLFADNYRHQLRAGRELGLPPLVASYGNALVDRAVLDAVCRLVGVSFWTAMRSNLAGMTAHPVIADRCRHGPRAILPSGGLGWRIRQASATGKLRKRKRASRFSSHRAPSRGHRSTRPRTMGTTIRRPRACDSTESRRPRWSRRANVRPPWRRLPSSSSAARSRRLTR